MAEAREKSTLLRLLFVTPDGAKMQIECDEVQMTAQDNEQGALGGSFGVRKGHTAALAALEAGFVRALRGGETVLCAEIDGGFARIDGESVTVLTGKVQQH